MSRLSASAVKNAILVALALGVLGAACADTGVTPPDGPCTTDRDCEVGSFCDLVMRVCVPIVPVDGDLDGDTEDDGSDTVGEEDIPELEMDDPGNQAYIQIPAEVGFGAVSLGQTKDVTINILNTGVTPLEIYQVSYDPIAYTPEFHLDPTTVPTPGTRIEPGRGLLVHIRVTYEPVDAGADEGRLDIVSNARNLPFAQIRLFSDAKGDPKLCVRSADVPNINNADLRPDLDTLDGHQYRAALDFGNVRVGTPPVTETVIIENCGIEDGNHVLMVTGIAFETFSIHYSLSAPEVSEARPLLLGPRQTAEVFITFAPLTATCEDSSCPSRRHQQYLTIETNSYWEDQRAFPIDITGRSNGAILEVQPQPVCFDPTEYGQQRTMPVCIFNRDQFGATITLTDLEIGVGIEFPDTFTSDFQVLEPDCATPWSPPPGGVTLTSGQAYCFCLGYRPHEKYQGEKLVPKRDNAFLRIYSTLPEPNDILYSPICGQGRPPNEPPTAQISLQQYGAPISTEIRIRAPAELCFFAVYTDWDSNHQIDRFEWSWREAPANPPPIHCRRLQQQHPHCDSVCIEFERAGVHDLQLVVYDREGAANVNTDNWARINVSENRNITIRLDFSGADGATDVDLEWIAPNGAICSSKTMNSFRSCNLGEYGFPRVALAQIEAKRGTSEEIIHENPLDGVYRVQARLLENCDDWELPLIFELCLDRSRPPFTIRFSDSNPNDFPPTYFAAVSGQLRDKGDSKCWMIRRQGGVWSQPIVCP